MAEFKTVNKIPGRVYRKAAAEAAGRHPGRRGRSTQYKGWTGAADLFSQTIEGAKHANKANPSEGGCTPTNLNGGKVGRRNRARSCQEKVKPRLAAVRKGIPMR